MHIHETNGLIGVLIDAVMITGFVLVIMLVVEYLNVWTSGAFQGKLIEHKWQQYALAACLGCMPGCLGLFAVVSMFSHGVLCLGAVVTAMIATTGDEAFVMLAMFPERAITLMLGLTALGLAVGPLAEVAVRKWGKLSSIEPAQRFEVHEEDFTVTFNLETVRRQWRRCTAVRGVLSVSLAVFILIVLSGKWETDEWDWQRVTLLTLSLIAFFVVATVPDHFLEEHLWRHAAREHAPRIFAWTLGTLVVLFFLTRPLEHEQARAWLESGEGMWLALLFACAVGIIPQSGPHLLFVFAYAHGALPLGVLVASMLVQDGHGMLPMLAHSRRVFVGIKALKIILALLIGGTMVRFNL